MGEMIKELIKAREILFTFAWRDIKIRHKQTIMGFLWVLFMPMMVVLSGIVVKAAMAMISGKQLELTQISSVLVKSLPWAFFVGTLKFSTNSLVGNVSIVNKIYFPREVFPLSSVLTQMFDFSIATLILVIVLIFAKIGASIYLIWLPFLIICLILFTAGLGMFFACANLFFRDVKYLVDIVLTFGIFFTPVFYEANMFGKYETLLLLNPIGALLESINNVVVLHKAPDAFWLGYAAFWSIFVFFGSWYIFHKTEPIFAENI
jgi:lipopolysaccharide transport system permease protein